MSKKGRLTTKGKHTVILALTVIACMIGILFSLLLSAIGERKDASPMVYAGEVSHRTESIDASKPDTDLMTPQWLYYQSSGKGADRNIKKEMDILMRQWTKGKLEGKELCRLIREFLQKKNCTVGEIAMQEKALCVFPSQKELPDYTKTLAKKEKMYQFIGVYTAGEQDEKGRLLCEYWEVAIR